MDCIKMRMKQLVLIISTLYSFSCLYSAASVAEEFTTSPKALPSIISEKKALQAGTNSLGLFFTIKKGWHIYWKNPGDAGLPPKMDWKGLDGVKISTFKWPYPKKITVGSLVNYGYEKEVLLPFSITIPKNFLKKRLTLTGVASWLVCKDICIKEQAPIKIDIPVSVNQAFTDYTLKSKFDKARKKIPEKLDKNLFSIRAGEKELQLHLNEFFLKKYKKKIDAVFPVSKFVKNNIPPEIKPTATGISIKFTVDKNIKDDNFFSSVLLIKRNEQYQPLEIKGGIKKLPFIQVIEKKELKEEINFFSFIKYIFFAFLGGLILNLMPCVFPILSLKIFSFLNHKEERTYISGLFYTLGVLSFFLVIGAVFIFLRSKGAEIGWGFQLQSPIFILFLIVLFLVISLNLLGIFDFSGRFSSLGGKLAYGDTMLASFFTGGLAVLVATPCSAPFMAVAIGFSLTQTAFISMLIFAFLGLGLAAPYALLSFFPKLSSFLPKPGKWMQTLRELLAFPLLLTIVWLLWVFDLQMGANSLLYVLCGITLIYFTFWLNKKLKNKIKYFMIILNLVLIGFLFYSSVSISFLKNDLTTEIIKNKTNTGWEPFSISLLDKYLSKNEKVFVNFTAAWCITCKINERAVLNKKNVQEVFKNHDIKTLKADWTNENKEISQTLKKYGRGGIPLYLFFNGTRTPVILPQILQEKNLLRVLTKE